MREGQSAVLVIRGEAGIGKSALLQFLVERATGFTVIHANGVESEMELPFAALHQLCSGMLGRLEALPEPQRVAASTAFGLATGESPDRLLTGLAVLNVLSAVSDEAPLLCAVDDAQWLDRESAQVLAFVARRLLADRVGLVFASRDPGGDLSDFPEMTVERLHERDARALLGAVLRVPLDDRVRDRVVAETHGNPLALVEWPRGVTLSELGGGFAMPALMPIAGQLEEGFRRRVAELPAPTQRFLTVVAAEPTGDSVVVWQAARALGISPRDVAPAIDSGLAEIGVRIWFRHPMVRSAVYGSASQADRQAAHQQLAAATDPDRDPDRRAWHQALGSPGPDEEIAEALERSADRAKARGGFGAAGALLERSVALSVDPRRRSQRILSASEAHLEAGSYDIAAGLLASAEGAVYDQSGRIHLELLRAAHSVSGGDVRDAPELWLGAARLLEEVDRQAAGITYLQALGSACVVGNLTRGISLAEVALATTRFQRSSSPTPTEWLVAGLAQVTVEGPLAAAPALRRALRSSRGETSPLQPVHWLGYQEAAATVLWDADVLHEMALVHVNTARDLGALNALPTALNGLALVLVLEGDLDGAGSAMTEANQVLEATGSHLVVSVDATCAALAGDAKASTVIDQQAAAARSAGHGLALKGALWARATLQNSLGQYENAFVAGNEAMEHPWEWVSHLFFHELVEAAARTGRIKDAAHALDRLGETVGPDSSDWALGVQARSLALVASGTHAEDLYREAIERLGRTRIRSELARAHLLYGEWLRRENRRVDARSELRAAHDMLMTMKFQLFAERARRELLATGETVRKRTADSLDKLTPQEAHIARLAAEGRTNPEIGAQLFISPRTVEWHLRKVFTKLSVTSRRELREVLPRVRLTA